MKWFIRYLMLVLTLFFTFRCAHDPFTEGTQPANEKERIKFHQALLRCNKTGGSKIIKIMGKTRCF
jgi:hypothetical protein